MKYAILDKSGNQIQWCNDDTVSELPKNAILLTDEEWENRLSKLKDPILELKNSKISKLLEIQTKRKEFQYSPITINGKTYKNTEIAQGKFFHLLSRTQDVNYPIKWRLDDDITWVDLSKIQVTNLSNRIIEQETSTYQQESDFILQVQNAQTLEELDQIVINFQ